MSFDVHPILEPGFRPSKGVWYAIAPESSGSTGGGAGSVNGGPCPRVGANANYIQTRQHLGGVLLSAGATPEGPFSDLHQLSISKGE
jgi:hypothetical protein